MFSPPESLHNGGVLLPATTAAATIYLPAAVAYERYFFRQNLQRAASLAFPCPIFGGLVNFWPSLLHVLHKAPVPVGLFITTSSSSQVILQVIRVFQVTRFALVTFGGILLASLWDSSLLAKLFLRSSLRLICRLERTSICFCVPFLWEITGNGGTSRFPGLDSLIMGHDSNVGHPGACLCRDHPIGCVVRIDSVLVLDYQLSLGSFSWSSSQYIITNKQDVGLPSREGTFGIIQVSRAEDFGESRSKERRTLLSLNHSEGINISAVASPLCSGDSESPSPALADAMEMYKNLPSRFRRAGNRDAIISLENLESLPSKLGEVVGITNMEEVMEKLLQEEILDETDKYVDLNNKNRINLPSSRAALGSPKSVLISLVHWRTPESSPPSYTTILNSPIFPIYSATAPKTSFVFLSWCFNQFISRLYIANSQLSSISQGVRSVHFSPLVKLWREENFGGIAPRYANFLI
ncbi:hypothetical protein NL676_033766 [Syzygium grande]|nr:hypothetical protein NL676_033766 [Syzygium grande]